MGVIKKKTGVRGTEGGLKYVCDVCSADITSTVRIRCADSACKDYDLCVPCFSEGSSTKTHDPRLHSYSVIEQHSIPIFEEDWGADEENLLIEGCETYGIGSWADIADHVGGYRTKDEVRDHYINTYLSSSKFPLPERASLADRALADEWPREKFQARKKRRIEERKEEAKNAPPQAPKQKPTSSVPSCHEVQGYMPGRLEFEAEYLNDAEEPVQHMQFEPGDGLNPMTGELEPEMALKQTVMEIYNNRLTARVERKRHIFEHQLLEYRKNMAADKKRTKEERDLYNKCKPIARLMRHEDFETFTRDLEYELNLRQAISQLQDWRQVAISDLKAGEKYETEKAQRAAKIASVSSYDRFATSRNASKPTPPVEGPSAASALTGPEMPPRPGDSQPLPNGTASGGQVNGDGKALTNGTAHTNGTSTPIAHRPKFVMAPLSNVTPLKLNGDNAPDLHLLTPDEKEVCAALRIMPKPYIAIKENIFKEAHKHGGSLKKKQAKEISKIDSVKGGKLFDFFVHSGWIAKA